MIGLFALGASSALSNCLLPLLDMLPCICDCRLVTSLPAHYLQQCLWPLSFFFLYLKKGHALSRHETLLCCWCRTPACRNRCFRCQPRVKEVIVFVLCLAVGALWIVYRNAAYAWIVQDLLGLAFLVYVMKVLRLGSLKVRHVTPCIFHNFLNQYSLLLYRTSSYKSTL